MLTIFASASILFLCWLVTLSGLHKLTPSSQAYYQRVITKIVPRFPALGVPMIGLLELGIGAALISSSHLIGLCLCGALMTGYTSFIAVGLQHGHLGSDCGCAGPHSDLHMSPHLIYRNGTLLLLIVLTALCPSTSIFNTTWFHGLQSLVLSGFLILFYLSSEQLIINQQKMTDPRTSHIKKIRNFLPEEHSKRQSH